MPKAVIHVIKKWIPLAIAITGVSFLSYGLVQQSMRAAANDPQVQVATDVVNFLNTKSPFPNSQTLDPTKSLAPFIVVYNKNGEVISSTAVVDGKPPIVPKGVLDTAAAKGDDRVTWLPKKGLRVAAVVKPYDEGFVLVGRNLKEVEARDDDLFRLMLLCWAATMITSLASIIVLEVLFPRPQVRPKRN